MTDIGDTSKNINQKKIQLEIDKEKGKIDSINLEIRAREIDIEEIEEIIIKLNKEVKL